jgi:hypothetical protein
MPGQHTPTPGPEALATALRLNRVLTQNNVQLARSRSTLMREHKTTKLQVIDTHKSVVELTVSHRQCKREMVGSACSYLAG